jgi:regulator of sirC expression with transglutaminase-like and TPR domain
LQAWWQLAQLYLDNVQEDSAGGCLRSLEDLRLQSEHIHGSHLEALLRSRLLQCKGHWGDAAITLQDVLMKHPEHPEVIREIGLLYANHKKCGFQRNTAHTDTRLLTLKPKCSH